MASLSKSETSVLGSLVITTDIDADTLTVEAPEGVYVVQQTSTNEPGTVVIFRRSPWGTHPR